MTILTQLKLRGGGQISPLCHVSEPFKNITIVILFTFNSDIELPSYLIEFKQKW